MGSKVLKTVGKVAASLAKGYGKQTAKKREKEDVKAAADKEKNTQKNSG